MSDNFQDSKLIIDILNSLAKICNKTAEDHGFWKDEDDLIHDIEYANSVKLLQCKPIETKNKKRIISLFNSEKIALEMSELAERLECLRKDPEKMDEHCPDFLNLEIEVADLIIRSLDFCGRRKLRIGDAIIAKMKYNSSRAYLHGKKF